MTVRGQVISEDGSPLDSASITLVNSKGEYLGEGVRADSSGKFAITSMSLKGNYLLVSFSGMTSLMIYPEDYTGDNYKEIVMFPKELDEVVVVPGNNKESNWLWLLALVGIALVAGNKKKRKKN